MIVLKFGGTSVGSIASLKNVKDIVENIHEPVIVVVSALGGLTDKLISTARSAASGNPDFKNELPDIAKRHHDIIDALVVPAKKQQVQDTVDALLSELFRLYDGVALIADLPTRTLDNIVSFGERMSSVIVAGIIKDAVHHNSPDFIKTEKWFDKNIADTKLTDRLIREEFSRIDNHPVVMGGFIASDHESGEITNLGRGGSDYTAALVAAALNADSLQIWTDVDGFMTSDPRIIPSARIIPEMTFIESMELCSFGAKVIYPPTIYPVFHKNIPIRILNTFNPSAPGTFISDTAPSSDSAVTGLSTLKNTALISIEGAAARNLPGMNTRSFNSLARHGISVYLVAQSNLSFRFSFAIGGNDLDKALKILRDEFAPEIATGKVTDIYGTSGLATLAVVGERLSKASGITSGILNRLAADDIIPLASSNGNSKTTITFVIKEEEITRAIILIHELFFPAETE
ncbi:MAG: aspartate kinase [Muribaculum sp.]|nr:aspartate kinase [Muribaculum sp.]